MADQESEDLQLRREEIDILNSIYIDELLIRNNKCGIAESIEIVLHPATAGQADQQYVCLTLHLHIPEEYPNVEPGISIKNPRGISDEFVDSLKRSLEVHASENLGHQVLFSLIQHANDSLTYNNTPSCDCAVCLTGFQDEDAFTKTECYHYFHISCLERYIDVCTKDHQKEVAEIQESGSMPQQTPKELQIVCPVCREPISYQSESENKNINVKPVEDDLFVPDESMRRWQEKMKRLYQKQEKQGGIIDVEAESNRFLLDISTTVSTLTLDDDKKSSASNREERGYLNSRRENYSKYGNRSNRYGERRQSNKDQTESTRYRRKVHSNGEVVTDRKTELDPNDRNDGRDARGSNKSPVQLSVDGSNTSPVQLSGDSSNTSHVNISGDSTNMSPVQLSGEETGAVKELKDLQDMDKSEEDFKKDHFGQKDDLVNDNGSEIDTVDSHKVNEDTTLVTLCDQKNDDIGRDETNDNIQKDGKHERNNKNTNYTNHERRGGRNNFRTGENKSGHWRSKDENDYSKDRRTHQTRSGGATAGSERCGSAGNTTRNQRYRSGYSQRPKSGGGASENIEPSTCGIGSTRNQRYRSGYNQRPKSGDAASENKELSTSGVATTRNQRDISDDRSGPASTGVNKSDKKRSDGLVSDSTFDIREKEKCNKKSHVASERTSRDDTDKPHSRKIRESGHREGQAYYRNHKDGQSYYRNHRHSQKKYPDETKKKPNEHSAEKLNLCNSEPRAMSHASKESPSGKKPTTTSKGSSAESSKKATSSSSVPPGFKSKGPILPPSGF